MKAAVKLKKDKSPIVKIPIPNTKKPEPKKLLAKKEEPTIPKTISLAGHTKAATGITTGTQSTKQLNPSLGSMKSSPKASLAELKAVQEKKTLVVDSKVKKIDIADKSKEQIKKSLANVIKVYYPQKKNCLDISMTEITKDTTQKDDKASRNDFNFLQIIGEGGYGKVWKVQQVKTKRLFAMKEMSKALIVMKKSVDNVLNERKILQELNSPFIANMCCAFNDRDNLYLIMDLLTGGDLRYRIGQIIKFSEDQSKFLIACILAAVEYIHNKKIFHRDIKPQNLVFDNQGYLRLTDFGIARMEHSKQSLDASGTPGYMAPEVLCKQMHSYEVDFYAIGIIAYELMLGKRPYSGNNRIQIRDAILSKQHSIKKSQIPTSWSVQAADFANRLIQRSPNTRLGSKGGIKQIKSHPWFSNFAWNDLESKKIKSPFKEKDHKMELQDRIDDYDEALMQYKLLQRAENKLDAFAKYYFQMAQK